MKKNTLTNLALLLLVVVLALLAVYEPGVEKPAELPSLLTLERDAVNHIVIRRDGQDTIDLKKDNGGKWQLLQPVQAAASDFRIDSLLRITHTKSLADFPADKVKLPDYQLDKPRIELILNDTTHIAFGSSTPLDQRRYVMLDGKVHLISDTLYYHLIGAYPTFIRLKPLPEDASIEAMHLPGLMLQWQAKRWQVTPKPESFSADQVTRLLDAWKMASAVQVKSYDGSKGDPISLQLKGAVKPLNFIVTATSPDLVLARPDLGIEYHFPADSANTMLSLPKPEKAKSTDKSDGIN